MAKLTLWEFRNIHGLLTDADVLALPDAPVPLPAPYAVPRTVDEAAHALTKAIAEKYRIERCPSCGGPKVFSKVHPIARCFRCGTAEALENVAQHERSRSWRRCALCNKQNMGGLSVQAAYCRACGRLSTTEREKRLRWKAEKEAAHGNVPSGNPNKIKGEFEPT